MQQAVSLTEAQVDGLVTAYIERKKFETKVMLSIVAEALKPKEKEMSLGALSAMGFGIRGA
jgi:hypothetical protein